MKNWTIKSKIILLSASLLVLTLVLGAVQYYGSSKLQSHLENISNVQLPAVRSMTLVDMMHDGIRAVVYRALYEADHGDLDAKKEVASELEEMTGNISTYIGAIDKLDIASETRKAIDDSKAEIEAYVKSSEKITALALAGKTQLAINNLPQFNDAFSSLEEKLEKLGELIEKNAEDEKNLSVKSANTVSTVGVALIGFGILFGLILSFFTIRDVMRTLTSVITELASTSQEVTSASSQSASLAQSLSESSTQQASSLQETMASAEQISAMVNQNADSAKKVKDVVDTNDRDCQVGSQNVSEMLVAINEIKRTNGEILNQMEGSNKEFGEIVKIISEIGEKTKVINDIVFQTKLLSFNASVEAARAGEHGKGFAVVAEEVGNLAQMSGNAAKQITDMLSSSIKKVNEIVETTTHKVDQLVEIGKDKVAMGQSTAQKCQEALNRIASNAKTTATMISEISHASQEQAQGVQEINKAISQLDQVTQQNSAVAQQSSAQASLLKSESNSLEKAVQTLVAFVGSVNDNQYREEHGLSSRTRPNSSGKGNTYSKTGTANNVLSLKTASSNSTMTSGKMVAGSDVVPSGNSSEFEEF